MGTKQTSSRASDSPVLTRYAACVVAWWVAAGGFAVAMSLRYLDALDAIVAGPVAWAMLGAAWFVLFVPALAIVASPLRARVRSWTA